MDRPLLKFKDEMVPGKISIILPSRGRARTVLPRAINSLRDTALHPELIEFLVAYDPDDPDTGVAAAELGVVHTWVAPQRLGWGGNHIYFGHLVEMTSGEWICPWGDDGEMLTSGWDGIVRRYNPGVLYCHGGLAEHNVFPFIHRKLYEIMGTYLPSPHGDSWWTDVARMADCLYDTDIRIVEHRPDTTGCAADRTYVEGRSGYESAKYYSHGQQLERAEDARRIRIGLGGQT